MNDLQSKASEIIALINEAKYMVHIADYNGLRIEATASNSDITFYHNLGGFNVPSKKEAEMMISTIEEFFHQLYYNAMEFRSFVADRILVIDLYVFSGQIDFCVARYKNHKIEWIEKLD
jgi:hypothetical protein